MTMAASSSNSVPRTAREAALWLLSRGYAPLPLPHRSKIPPRENWPALRLTAAEVPREFTDPANIGIILGEASGGLIDVDLDCPQARVAAPFLLPSTGMVSGRKSAPDSHWWYVVENPPAKASDAFLDPTASNRTKLLELRSTGGQTVVPPSVYPAEPDKGHPNDELCLWRRHDEPARVDLEALRVAVGAVAAASLLARCWPSGARHDAALALAGGLLRAGWNVERVERFARAVCAASGDREVNDRLAAVRDTAAQMADGKHATGWPTLERVLGAVGASVVGAVRVWLRCHVVRGAAEGQSSHPGQGPALRYAPILGYKPFPTDCLPAPWDAFVREGAAALRCDEALVALPLLAVLASTIGNTRRVHLGAEWYEPAVLWTCVVAESGGRKSPAAELSAERVKARQKRLVKEFKDAVKEYKRQMAEYKARKKDVGEEQAGDEPQKPTLGRVLVSDITIEKLAGLLDDNRRGLLVYRDELAGWVGSFTKYKGKGGGSDEPNWLSIHRGDAIIYDRKTGEKTSVFVPHAAVSVCGGIQPGVLQRLASHDLFDSGMVARLVFAMPPRTPKTWSDDQISLETKTAADRSLAALYELSAEVDEDGDPRPVVVGLAREARERLKSFVNEWGLRQFEAEGERAAALAKLEALPGRFALIHHTVLKTATFEDTDPIGLESLEAGIRLAEWCANETDRVYAIIHESAENKELRKLVETVTRLVGRHGGRLTTKQLQNSNSRKYPDSAAAQATLERLVGLGLGRWESEPASGKGGHRPAYFVPATPNSTSQSRPTSDSDSSDSCPSDGFADADPHPAGASDSCPEPEAGRPPAEMYCRDESPDIADVCGESIIVGPEQESEESESETSGPKGSSPEVADRCVGSESRNDQEARVGSRLIADTAGLTTVVAMIRSVTRAGLDLETTGLNPARDRVRLLSLATPTATFVIDLFAFADPMQALRPLLEALVEKAVVGHNIISFDLPFLARLGFAPTRLFDTAIASRVVYAGEKVDHDLAAVVQRELGETLDKGEQDSDWSRSQLTDDQLDYAATDAAVLLPLADALREKAIERKVEAVVELEMRCGVPVAKMAANGVGFDAQSWLVIADAAVERRAALAAEMDALVPNPNCLPGLSGWNWDSNAGDVLKAFAVKDIELEDTKEETLAGIDHPLARLLLDYREAAKRANTYGREWVAEHVTDGRVYATWNLCQAKTGRMSCKGPNLQQVPRDVAYRRCLVAKPGHVLVKCDFSQIELRIAAKVTGDRRMMAAYQNGEDLHTLTAARFLGVSVEAVTKEARQMAKPVNFGAIYGLGPRSLRLKARADYGKEMTEEQARGFLNAFFAEFPGVRAWHNRLKRGRATEVRTLGGRRIAVEADQFHGAKANYVVQGCLQPQVRVLTDHGYLPIGQLYSSATQAMKVWTGTRWAPFTVRNMGPCQFAQVAFQDGTVLDCDTRHQLLTVTDSGYQWRGYSELRPDDRVATPLTRPMHLTPPRPLGNLDGVPADAEFWYWIGYYYGNGWIGRERGELMFAFGPQVHRLAERSACEAYWRSRGVNAVSRDQPRADRPGEFAYTLTIYRAALIRALAGIGIGGGNAHTKRFPTRVFAETLAHRAAFARGFLAADGYLRGPCHGNPSVHLCQREMLTDLKLLLRTLGVESNLRGPYFSKGHVSYRLDIHRRMYEEAFDPRQPNWPRLRGMDAPRFVVEELLSRYDDVPAREFPTASAYTLYRRLRAGGSVSAYTLDRLCTAMGWVLDSPLYGSRQVVSKRELPMVRDTFTLSVDDPLHRFDSEGVISKNTGGDGLKRALVLLWERRGKRPGAEVVLAVHDEVVIEVPETEAEQARAWVTSCMVEAMAPLINPVPVEVEAKVGRTWGG